MHTNSRWIRDSNNKTVIIKGISKTGLEYLGLDLDSIIPEMIQYEIVNMNKWNINTVRIPLRDIHWLTNYKYRIKTDNFINSYLNAGFYVILDLHTLGYNPKQDKFIIKRGNNDGLEFWKNISKTYKNDRIFFELFNEPFDISPITWWYGDNYFYGYKTIIDEIRNYNNNLCIIGGLDYSYQWNFINNYPNIMNEMININNLVLSFHPYGYRGSVSSNGLESNQIPTKLKYPNNGYIGDCSIGYTVPLIQKSEYGWDESFGFMSEKFPMIATEFGLDHDDTSIQGGWYANDILEYINNKSIGYIAWAWTPNRLSYPSLLDKNLNPTGMADIFPYGPPCGTKENNYYEGPGKLVFNDLNKNIRQLKYEFNDLTIKNKNSLFHNNRIYYIIFSIFFIIMIILIMVIFNLIKELSISKIEFKSMINKSDNNNRPDCYNKLRSRCSKLNICIK